MPADLKAAVQDLLARLQKLDAAAERGYQVTADNNGDLLVCRRGHWRGMWRYSSSAYAWIVAGNNEPSYRSSSIDEAVAYSAQHIFVE